MEMVIKIDFGMMQLIKTWFEFVDLFKCVSIISNNPINGVYSFPRMVVKCLSMIIIGICSCFLHRLYKTS